MANFFFSRSDARGIVVFTDEPDLLIGKYAPETPLYIVRSLRQFPLRKWGAPSTISSATYISARRLSPAFLTNKIVIDTRRTSSKFVEAQKQRLFHKALLAITISTRPTPPINSSLLRGPVLVRQKEYTIELTGELAEIDTEMLPEISVLAILHVYNEEDIIESTVRHLLEQGVDVHIIDNWSTDSTTAIIKELTSESPRVTTERFPKKPTAAFELGKLLTHVTDVAKARPGYQWIMINDADEIRWSPWAGVSLRQAISFVDSLRYSAIDFTVFNFEPTKDGFNGRDNPLTFFRYGSFGTLPGYFAQVKAWRNNPDAEASSSGGHHVQFPNQRIFPFKFLLGHYPIRSTKQGTEKIFRDRIARYSKTERKKGWHTHYDNVRRETRFIKNPKTSKLIAFNFAGFYDNYLIERISGVGLIVKD